MIAPEKKARQIPRWIEWVLALAMAVLTYLEYTHGENFWSVFFAVATIIMVIYALGLFGRSSKGDSDAR
jgi:hypothetical protein